MRESTRLLPALVMVCTAAVAARAETTPRIPWRDWSEATFADARTRGKLIFVDVGTEWCTACKWQEEGTYTDPAVAKRLSEHFVSIKVDAELQPDIGERYAAWGWPALIFLAPDGTQVRAEQGNRRPRNFIPILDDLIARQAAGTLSEAANVQFADTPVASALATLRDRTAAQLDRSYDPVLGGWGKRQKLPVVAPIEHALYRARARDETLWLERAKQTLGAMADLTDPIWGGVYAGAMGGWQNGFPEKLLRNQAGALLGYALAHHATGDARWRAAAENLIGYLDAFLRVPEGGYAASQDAELADHSARTDLGPREYFRLDDRARRALGVPPIDPSVHTDANALLARAFTALYAATGAVDYRRRGLELLEFLVQQRRTEDGAFRQFALAEAPAVPRVRALSPASANRIYLRTQAQMGLAMLAAYAVTGAGQWQDHALALAAAMRTRLEDPIHGGFYASDARADASAGDSARQKPLLDNGVAARFLIELGYLVKDDSWRGVAERALRGVGQEQRIEYEGRMVGEYLLALEKLTADQIEFSIVTREPAAGGDLFEASVRVYEPRKIVKFEAPGRYPDRGRPALYVCTTTLCSQPIVEADKVAAGVREFLEHLQAIRILAAL